MNHFADWNHLDGSRVSEKALILHPAPFRHPVWLELYDLSQDQEHMGAFSRWFNSFHANLTGASTIIPHTAVIVYGHRIEFGVYGQTCKKYLEVNPQDNEVHKIWFMGTTTKSLDTIRATRELLQTEQGFEADQYNVLEKNCLDFSNALLAKIVRKGIKIEIWQYFSRFHLSGLASMLKGLMPSSMAESASTMNSAMGSAQSLLAFYQSLPFGNHPWNSSRSQFYLTFASDFVMKMYLPSLGPVVVRVAAGTICSIAMVAFEMMTASNVPVYLIVKLSPLLLDHLTPLSLQHIMSDKKFGIELTGQQIKLTIADQEYSMSIMSLYQISSLVTRIGIKSLKMSKN